VIHYVIDISVWFLCYSCGFSLTSVTVWCPRRGLFTLLSKSFRFAEEHCVVASLPDFADISFL